jgi:hypothetical protein
VKSEAAKSELPKPVALSRPWFIIDAVTLLASDTSESKIGMGLLGQLLKRTDPAFSPKLYGHSGLLDMVKTYDLLRSEQEVGGHWSVSLAPKTNLLTCNPVKAIPQKGRRALAENFRVCFLV